MKIILKMAEILILATLKSYYEPLFRTFPGHKTQNFGNELSRSPQMAYRSYVTTCSWYI